MAPLGVIYLDKNWIPQRDVLEWLRKFKAQGPKNGCAAIDKLFGKRGAAMPGIFRRTQ